MIRTTIIAATLAFAATTASAQPVRAPAAQAAPFAADVVIQVNGLVCDFCAQAIEKSFKRHAEVNAIRVDLTAKLVSVDFRPDMTMDDAALRRIVTNAGYAVVAIRRTGARS